MPEIILPGAPARSEITTQTRAKWNIPNSQSLDSSLGYEREHEKKRREYPQARFRTGVIPVYNCHGLTFGARRTTIWQIPAVQQILRDDHYERVVLEEVEPGDIVLYISAEDGDIEHSGIVVHAPEPPLLIPRVWSKWGFGAEVVHFANDCPYDFSQAQYYRIRS